jgi:hypothetical protein
MPVNADQSDRAPDIASPYGDVLIGGLFGLFAILMFVGAQFFPHRSNMGFVTAASFTPMMLGIIVTALSMVLVISALKKPKNGTFREWLKVVASDDRTRRSVLIGGITLVYIILIGRVHFLPVNFVYLIVMYRYLRVGGWPKVLILGTVNAVLIAYLVPMIFQMPLP